MQRGISIWLVALCAVALPAPGGDWPQFRGPARLGTADESGLLTGWGDGRPVEVWRNSIGNGYSGVAAVGPRLFTMARSGDAELVLALDRESGDVVWWYPVGPVWPSAMEDDGPRATPTVVGGVVCAVSSAARLVALAAADGSPIWERDLQEYGPVPEYGYSVSPLVDRGRVVVEAGGGEDAGIYAFDLGSGALAWTALRGPAGYSSPIAVEIAGRRQYVFFREAGREVVALEPDGKVLWRHPTASVKALTTPVFLPPDRIFVAGADDEFGGLMLEVIETEGVFEAKEIWSERSMRNHFSSSVAAGDHLYGFDNGTLRCLDAESGAPRWARRGLGKGSLIASSGLLLVLSDDGTLVLLEAASDEYREKGRVQVLRGRTWTSPSLADGRLYLRDFDEIVSLDLRDPAPGGSGEGARP